MGAHGHWGRVASCCSKAGLLLACTTLIAMQSGCVASSAEFPELRLAGAPAASAPSVLPETDALPFEPETHPLATAKPAVLDLFDVSGAMIHVRHLADVIGERPAGGPGERAAAEYIAAELSSWGYAARLVDVPLPNGLTSVNVIAERRGTSDYRFVLGAHFDTKSPSPGANDNATGVGVVLEIARQLADMSPVATIEFAFFGAEERIDGNTDHHHYGSRARVAAMSSAEMQATVGMVSVDMIGYGPGFHVRTMRRGPQSLSNALLAYAKDRGMSTTYLKDPGSSGWSDHEAYELAGVPAAWVEWRDDPVYHTAGDTASHVQTSKVDAAGELVWGYVAGLDEATLASLK